MTPSECEDCEYDTDCDQCSESVLVCVQTPPPLRKNRFFLRGGEGLYTGYCRCRAINIPSDQTVEKNLAVKGWRKVNNIRSGTIETDKALFCPRILHMNRSTKNYVIVVCLHRVIKIRKNLVNLLWNS